MKDIITYCEIKKGFTRPEVLLFDRSQWETQICHSS